MSGTEEIVAAPTREAEPSHTRSVRSARRMHRGRAANVHGCQEGPLVASIRTAVASGVISGQLARTLRHWAKRWCVPELPDALKFRHNSRLRRTIARWVIKSNTVELSTRFFEVSRDHREILCHELAHAAAVRMRGRSVRPHGPAWCELLREAGYEPRAHCVSDRRKHAFRRSDYSPLIYEHRCPVCHAVRHGKRPVKSWRCVECVGAGLAGQLVITAVPNRAGVK